MRSLLLILILLPLAACNLGSTTTRRPAIDRPAIGPEGVFWDAVTAAEMNDLDRFSFLLSARFLHESILPRRKRNVLDTQAEFVAERERLLLELEPYGLTVSSLRRRYMQNLRDRIKGTFVQTGNVAYGIQHVDEFGVASGPNRATLKVSFQAKGHTEDDYKPLEMKVRFIQDRHHWLIDGFDPDPLKGAFTQE